jgi:diguanylate cyclase (GGDEF)-like protein
MAVSPDGQPAPPSPAPTTKRRRYWPVTLPILVPVAFFVAHRIGMILREGTSGIADIEQIPVVTLFCLTCLCVSLGILIHHHRHWNVPARQLLETLRQVRNSERPTDDLARISGPLAPLANEISLLVRDYKIQRSHANALDLEMSQRVANRTGAMERTISALRHQAVHDPLTGLFNRRMLNEYLPKVLDDCRQRDESVCLLAIDVDDFKLLNDTLGHAAGDRFLANLGQLIRSAIRDNDAGFRCGGDEFVVVLPGCTGEKGRAIADRLVVLVSELGKTLHVFRPPHLSIGVVVDSGGTDAHTLLTKADQLTYEVKRARKATLKPVSRVA